jgi:2-dehydropantoate 2-reductase
VRIAVVGAGAIGGFVAAALARAGEDVAVVARGAHLDAIRENGLAVTGELGAFSVRVRASDRLAELGDFDALLLTFKAHQWPAFVPQLEAYSRKRTPIVTLQNGVPFWFARTPPLRTVDPDGTIGKLFPDELVVGGVVHQSGNVAAPGAIAQSGGIRYLLGDPNGGTGPLVTGPLVLALRDAFRGAGLQPMADTSIRERVWYKLINNASLNPVSAIEGITTHQMYADPATRALLLTLMQETLDVGQALGLCRDVDVESRIKTAAAGGADVRTSMLQDLEAGRPLELDPIVGAVVELADRVGVAVPHLRAQYDALRERSRV